MKKISVIVPYWNAEKWIKRCAESLKSQEGEYEFIFVNDGSTDGSLEVLKGVADDRFVMIDNDRGRGVSGARNSGLDISGGEWIAFLDADDEMMPRAMEKFNGFMAEGYGINQFDHVRYYVETGREINLYPNASAVYGLDNLPLVWYGVWNKLYRHSVIYGIRFDEGLQYGEDELFNLECLSRCGEINHDGFIGVKHHIENKNSLSYIRTRDDLIKHIKALEDYIVKEKNPVLRQIAYDRVSGYLNTAWYREAIIG